MNICITGYRPNKLPARYGYDIHNKSWQELKRAFMDVSLFLWAQYGQDLTIYTGMALGVDQAFAEASFVLQKTYPHIKTVAAIPCYNQENKWPVESRELYHKILAQCTDLYHVTKSTYTPDCMETRNRWMVDHSSIVVAVYDGKSGGTRNCIRYAEKHGKTIITIRPNDLVICCDKDLWRLL